jgi:hypothetical protein
VKAVWWRYAIAEAVQPLDSFRELCGSLRFTATGAGHTGHNSSAGGQHDAVLDSSPDIVLIDAALERNGAHMQSWPKRQVVSSR